MMRMCVCVYAHVYVCGYVCRWRPCGAEVKQHVCTTSSMTDHAQRLYCELCSVLRFARCLFTLLLPPASVCVTESVHGSARVRACSSARVCQCTHTRSPTHALKKSFTAAASSRSFLLASVIVASAAFFLASAAVASDAFFLASAAAASDAFFVASAP